MACVLLLERNIAYLLVVLRLFAVLLHLAVSHANSFYSGVFYHGETYGDPPDGMLWFKNPIRDQARYEFEADRENYVDHDFSIIPQPNLLVLFPSQIKHWVYPYNGKEDRVSLAFNIIPKGCYGIGDSYIDTKWIQ